MSSLQAKSASPYKRLAQYVVPAALQGELRLFYAPSRVGYDARLALVSLSNLRSHTALAPSRLLAIVSDYECSMNATGGGGGA